MRRSILIFLGVLAIGVAAFIGAYYVAQNAGMRQMANSADDLAWLQSEFKLGPAEMARIREMHEGYMPKCSEMCRRIAAKKNELEIAMAGTTSITDTARQKLFELGELRTQCQEQMLQHFVEVSQAMPPEQGRRYLAEMRRLTLGAHEQIERSMSHTHGHGEH